MNKLLPSITGIILLISHLIISYPAWAQKNLEPGFIIGCNNDTIYGYIDNREKEKNPKKIFFRETLDGNEICLTPSKIKGFYVCENSYESGIIEVETSSLTTNNLSRDSDLKIMIDTAFLQAIIKGDKSLYVYMNSLGKENFYIKNNDKFELLVYKRYLNENYQLMENKRYVGQLTLYLADNPSIQEKIQDAGYFRNNLTKLFIAYYNSSSHRLIYQKKEDKVIVNYGILVGGSLTDIRFNSKIHKYLTEVNFPGSYNFTAGIFLDFIFPMKQRKWSVRNEIIYTTFNSSGMYTENVSENVKHVTTTELGYSYIKMMNMLSFRYPVGKFFVSLCGGFSNGYVTHETNSYIKESQIYYTTRNTEGKAIDRTRKHEEGLIIGAGASYHSLSLEIRYEVGNGMSGYNSLSSNTSRSYLMLRYRIH